MSEVDHGLLSLRRNDSRVTTETSTTSAEISDAVIVSNQRRSEAEDELELSSDDESEEDRVEEDKMIKVDSLMQIRRWVKRQIKYFTLDTEDTSVPISGRIVRHLSKLIVSVDNVIDLLDEKRRRGFPKYEQRRTQRRRQRKAATLPKIFDEGHEQSTNSEHAAPPSSTPTLLAPQKSPSDQARTRSKSSLNRRPAYKSKSTSLNSRKVSSKINRCPTCRKTFSSKSNLTTHRFTHLSEEEKAVAKEGWRHGCYFCDTRFKSPSNLARHLSTHTKEKPHRCDQCGKQFAQDGNLTTHKLIHIANPKLFTCEECDRPFTQKHTLIQHKKFFHRKLIDVGSPKKHGTMGHRVQHRNGVRPKMRHPCPHCHRSFKHKSYVRNHVRKFHPVKSRPSRDK